MPCKQRQHTNTPIHTHTRSFHKLHLDVPLFHFHWGAHQHKHTRTFSWHRFTVTWAYVTFQTGNPSNTWDITSPMIGWYLREAEQGLVLCQRVLHSARHHPPLRSRLAREHKAKSLHQTEQGWPGSSRHFHSCSTHWLYLWGGEVSHTQGLTPLRFPCQMPFTSESLVSLR